LALYLIGNGAMPTTAAFVAVTTGTAIKTMLQVKPGATTVLKIIEWGISFDGSAAATPGKVELIETDVAATVTASVANDITKYDPAAIAQGDPTTALIAVGTSSTGYTATAEGSITAVRNLAGRS
jgi:phosphoribosylaminoimidazole (AIR) synthetase